jgi:hypothetical protein
LIDLSPRWRRKATIRIKREGVWEGTAFSPERENAVFFCASVARLTGNFFRQVT